MNYLKMLFVSTLVMAIIFPVTASARDPQASYDAQKAQSMNRNMEGKAGAGYSKIKTTKSYGRTTVTGIVVNRKDKTGTGDVVGSEIKVDGEGGKVIVRGTAINLGDITAKDKNKASATGAGVTVTDATTVNAHVNVINRGDVTASASGRGDVTTSATGALVNIESTNGKAVLRGNLKSTGKVTATSNAR